MEDLNLDFFEMIAQSDFVDRLVFMCARDRATGEKLKAKDVFAGTFSKLLCQIPATHHTTNG
jgi:hypothetical protein